MIKLFIIIIVLIANGCKKEDSCDDQIPSPIEFKFVFIDNLSGKNLFFGESPNLTIDSLLFKENNSESTNFSTIPNQVFFLEGIYPDNAKFSFDIEYNGRPIGFMKVNHDGSEIPCDWGKGGINQGIEVLFNDEIICVDCSSEIIYEIKILN